MDESTPLLPPFRSGSGPSNAGGDHVDQHAQFCHLIGVRPINHPRDEEHQPHAHSLYARALKRRRNQNFTYVFTAALVNTLLLTQIVLGAALTGLGASNSSRILITVFGALNTIIAGVIAFLKSRGQPVRSRMFRDDLSRVVDEIENSAVMWYGISADAHGYDAIDTDEQVTVRGEVARLTRLYDKAVKTNTMNDPDMYSAGTIDSYSAGLRKALGPGGPQPPVPNPGSGPAAVPPQVLPVIPPVTPALEPDPTDASPASKPPEQPAVPPAAPSPDPADPSPDPADPSPDPAEPAAPADQSSANTAAAAPAPAGPAPAPADEGKGDETVSTTGSGKVSPPPAAVSAAAAAVMDPDASPASAAHFPKKEDSQKSEKTFVEKSSNVDSNC